VNLIAAAQRNHKLFAESLLTHIEENHHAFITDDFHVKNIKEGSYLEDVGLIAVIESLTPDERSFIQFYELQEDFLDELIRITEFDSEPFQKVCTNILESIADNQGYRPGTLSYVGMSQSDFL
jgi:hypothetical protein